VHPGARGDPIEQLRGARRRHRCLPGPSTFLFNNSRSILAFWEEVASDLINHSKLRPTELNK
jgi:hypothetical protein